jgi:hypothetical protein
MVTYGRKKVSVAVKGIRLMIRRPHSEYNMNEYCERVFVEQVSE